MRVCHSARQQSQLILNILKSACDEHFNDFNAERGVPVVGEADVNGVLYSDVDVDELEFLLDFLPVVFYCAFLTEDAHVFCAEDGVEVFDAIAFDVGFEEVFVVGFFEAAFGD